jgi:hypothetical protein
MNSQLRMTRVAMCLNNMEGPRGVEDRHGEMVRQPEKLDDRIGVWKRFLDGQNCPALRGRRRHLRLGLHRSLRTPEGFFQPGGHHTMAR